jgi:DNA-binding SARP family transcriptional activator
LLYKDDNVDNPANALKIIIHRLRRLLSDVDSSLRDCFVFNEAGYCWNSDCHCMIDVESFEDNIKRAEESSQKEKSIELYEAAIRHYKGEFLPHLSAEEWVISRSVRYQKMYLSCVRRIFENAGTVSDFKKMLGICSEAMSIYPDNEELYYFHIFSLYRLNRIKEAVQSYDLLVEMLFNEFGVCPGEEIQQLYDTITGDLNDVSNSVADIRFEMKEEAENGGAYCCNYQSFKDSYRFVVRGLERSGQSVFLMLLSLVTKQGTALKQRDTLQEVTVPLYKAIKSVLRKGDMFTRYSSSQYLILLVGINQENCSHVFTRIEKKFTKYCKNNMVHIQYKVISAIDAGINNR